MYRSISYSGPPVGSSRRSTSGTLSDFSAIKNLCFIHLSNWKGWAWDFLRISLLLIKERHIMFHLWPISVSIQMNLLLAGNQGSGDWRPDCLQNKADTGFYGMEAGTKTLFSVKIPCYYVTSSQINRRAVTEPPISTFHQAEFSERVSPSNTKFLPFWRTNGSIANLRKGSVCSGSVRLSFQRTYQFPFSSLQNGDVLSSFFSLKFSTFKWLGKQKFNDLRKFTVSRTFHRQKQCYM